MFIYIFFSYLKTLGVLRNIASEFKASSTLDKDVLMSIIKAKYVSPYSLYIREVGADPFFVHYHSDFQLMWYKKYCRIERSVLSLDATGGVLAPVIPPKDAILACDKKPNFLYLLKASTLTGSSVTVGQMISQRHSALKIAEWLRSWVQSVSTPMEIVMDESSALILATVQAFASCNTVAQYLKQCFDVLEERTTELPKCYIRLDVSHVTKTIRRSKVFENIDSRVKNFYLCCLGLMFWITEFKLVKLIIKDILTVCSNPKEEMKGIKLECEKARVRLCDLISTHNTTEIDGDLSTVDDQNIEEADTVNSFDNELEMDLNFYMLIKEGIVIESGDKDNMLYLPSLIPLLDKKIKQLPLWGAVMSLKFNSDSITCSSSNCEASFRYV